jgi:protein TonB
LAHAKRYPERALKRRVTGEGTIKIEIQSDGSLSDFQIIQSTDTTILDEELKAMVERAEPFPAFPNDLRKQSLTLVVPIAFRLEG